MDSIMIIGIAAWVIVALEMAFWCYWAYLERETYRIVAPYYKKRIEEMCKDEDMDKAWKDWCEEMNETQDTWRK